MPSLTFEEKVTFEAISCGECGVRFALDQSYGEARRKDHKTWYCPNGHPRHWPGVTDGERLQKLAGQLDIEKTRRENAERAVRQAEITKKALSTKLRKTNARIKSGVCPCCNRTFQSLARHMTTKHPEFVAESAGEE